MSERGFERDISTTNSDFIRGRNRLLAIGINQYEDAGIPNLNNAVPDTQAVAEVLQQQYQFEKEDCSLLLDSDADGDAIIDALDRMVDLAKAEDNVLIYIAGHGHYNKARKLGYFLPHDATPGRKRSMILHEELRTYLRSLEARHIFLVMDTCFSGALLVERDLNLGPKNSQDLARKIERFPSRWVLAAGQIETVEDGIRGDHSPFAQAFLTYLKTQDQARFPLSALIQHVRTVTPRNAKQVPMHGRMFRMKDQDGEMVFYRREQKRSEEESWQAALKAHTQTTYQAYLKQYPKGKHQEEAVWQLTLLKHEVLSYDDYLSQWPRGRYAKEALKRMKDLEEEQDWQKAQQRDNLGAYREYLNRYPQGKYIKQAHDRRGSLREGMRVKPSLVDTPQESVKAKPLKKQESSKTNLKPAASKPASSITTPSGTTLTLIEGGTFKMGSNEGYDDEKPIHEVSLSSFYLATHALTFDEYDAFCEATGKKKPKDEGWGRGRRPVIYVNWYDAVEYCNWLSEQEGLEQAYQGKLDDTVSLNLKAKGYRLPTEAEWEYAARGGKQSKGYTYAGSNEIDQVAWYEKNSNHQTHPVGQKQANELGLYDMSGNVWEWCWDWYGDYPQGAQTSPLGSDRGSSRVLRGGSWLHDAIHARVAYRLYLPDYRYFNVGLRLSRMP